MGKVYISFEPLKVHKIVKCQALSWFSGLIKLNGVEVEVASIPGVREYSFVSVPKIKCGWSRGINYLEWAFPLCFESSGVRNDFFYDPITYFQGTRNDFLVVVSSNFLFVVDVPEVYVLCLDVLLGGPC